MTKLSLSNRVVDMQEFRLKKAEQVANNWLIVENPLVQIISYTVENDNGVIRLVFDE